MHINEYLVQIAEEITEKTLPRINTESELSSWRKEKQKQFHKMIGIDRYLNQARTPLNVVTTGSLQRDGYTIKKLYFESLPGLFVTGNLYIPETNEASMPGIIYLCGHANKQKVHYKEHPRRFAQLGFVTLVLDTIQFGEVFGVHRGTHSHGMYDWISKGYSSSAVEIWNAIRAIDLLEELEMVDPQRIGMTGQSGGGSISWWTMCADDRVRTIASSCGVGTIATHVREEGINTHCDCVSPSNPYGWSLIEASTLLAPRPVLIVSPDEDKHFQIKAVRKVKEKLRQFYDGWGQSDRVEQFELPGRHNYYPESRKKIFSWFLEHLKDEKVAPEAMDDFDGFLEEEEDLLVYQGNLPANDESTTVQDWFIPLAELQNFNSEQEMKQYKASLLTNLKNESFAAFPNDPPDLNVQVTHKYYEKNMDQYHRFEYQSESEWRLLGELQGNKDTCIAPSPAAIYLRTEADATGFKSSDILDGLDSSWIKARIDTRGTGLTSWGAGLNTYLRRSFAMTGRTIASMRVWDTLRGIEAVRSFSEVDEQRIILAAEGEMAVPALYAALLDGNIEAVILKNPPASQNTQSLGGKNEQHLEILNSLRYTDIPQLAGLLWPTRIVFTGDRPDTYRKAEQLHRQWGEPGGTWRVTSLEEIGIFKSKV